jgi:DNA polymerase III subunit epsilon
LVDTLLLARRKYPGGPNRLDDLCQASGSTTAAVPSTVDAELLTEVYLELIEARQAQLDLVPASLAPAARTLHVRPFALTPRLSDIERIAHRALVAYGRPYSAQSVANMVAGR